MFIQHWGFIVVSKVMGSRYARGTNTFVWTWDTPWLNTFHGAAPAGTHLG